MTQEGNVCNQLVSFLCSLDPINHQSPTGRSFNGAWTRLQLRSTPQGGGKKKMHARNVFRLARDELSRTCHLGHWLLQRASFKVAFYSDAVCHSTPDNARLHRTNVPKSRLLLGALGGGGLPMPCLCPAIAQPVSALQTDERIGQHHRISHNHARRAAVSLAPSLVRVEVG